MQQYKLFNFDHGFFEAYQFSIGPFCIKINQEHCQNAELIPKHGGYEFSQTFHNNGIVELSICPTQQPLPAELWQETALVEIAETDVKDSILYPTFAKKKNIDDLCLLLSFLTGRRVCLEGDFGIYTANIAFDRIVEPNTIWTLDWKSVNNIETDQLSSQFYNFVLSYEQNQIVGRFAYVNPVLDKISGKWYSKHPSPGYDQNILSVLDLIKAELKCLLTEKGISEDLTDEFLAKMDLSLLLHNKEQPTALHKMKKLLVDTGMCPPKSKKIQEINKLRNDFVHRGATEIIDETENRVATFLCTLVQRIVQVYFASCVLKIPEDSRLKKTRDNIFRYFETGEYEDFDPKNQTLDGYIQYVLKTWEEKGTYIPDPKAYFRPKMMNNS